jgi:hypothetical protein
LDHDDTATLLLGLDGVAVVAADADEDGNTTLAGRLEDHRVQSRSGAESGGPGSGGTEAGYGTRIEGVTTDPNQPRVGVDISSPCRRHPDEEKS